MQVKTIVSSAAIAGVLAVSSSAFAGTGSNVDPEKKGAAGALETYEMADQLISYGLKQNDPLALVAGAKIKKGVSTAEVERKKAEEKAAGGAEGEKAGSTDTSAAAALGRAKELAEGQPDLLAMIGDVEAAAQRSLVGSSSVKTHKDRVKAQHTDVYRLDFSGDESAQVLVDGDGDTDLDLFVYDENDNLICSDTDSTDTMLCRWHPRWTGEFTIKIKNYGSVYNRYTMLID